jgi:hypothetical protein
MKRFSFIAKLVRVVIFFTLSFYSEVLLAKIISVNETVQLKNILQKVTPESLVVFDIDEVLIYPENVVQLQIGSPFWEASMADIEVRLGTNTRNLLHSIMLLESRWQLTDHMIPALIQQLQSKKIKTVALTAFNRGEMGKIKALEDWRAAQLKQYGIDFSISSNLSKNPFDITKLTLIHGKLPPLYKEGILYTNQYQKGAVLKAFLEQINLHPTEIIFIDDRIHNIKSVEAFCRSANIQFTGIHDNRILNKHTVFNKSLGQYQFHHLEQNHTWLSDWQAQATMQLLEQ